MGRTLAQSRFDVLAVRNRTTHKVSAMFDGIDETWEAHEERHLPVAIARHCIARTALQLDPRTNERHTMLVPVGDRDDDLNVIEYPDLTPNDETVLRQGGSLIPLDAITPPTGYVADEDGPISAVAMPLQRDVRYERGTAPEITNATRAKGGKQFTEPKPGWNKAMDEAADMAAEAAAQSTVE